MRCWVAFRHAMQTSASLSHLQTQCVSIWSCPLGMPNVQTVNMTFVGGRCLRPPLTPAVGILRRHGTGDPLRLRIIRERCQLACPEVYDLIVYRVTHNICSIPDFLTDFVPVRRRLSLTDATRARPGVMNNGRSRLA